MNLIETKQYIETGAVELEAGSAMMLNQFVVLLELIGNEYVGMVELLNWCDWNDFL